LKNSTKQLNFNKYFKFSKVSFSYNKDSKPIINNLSFKIYKGEKIGIVGQTGIGKSTLIDLIMGLLKPTDGKILVDDELIDQHKTKLWQLKIAHVPQNIFLVDGSILENIVFSVNNEDIDYKMLNNSIDMSEMKNFIENLPKGYHTIVGERGIKLSGGQRQRIAIARAIYKSKRLLVFDEATSSLDDRTEKLIGNSLENLDKEITIIMVAHRLSSLKKCDRIFHLTPNGLDIYNSYDEYCGSL
jgi:ABC-type bacteriocin/lantibiotic exporter with double-glycine peptidase domain